MKAALPLQNEDADAHWSIGVFKGRGVDQFLGGIFKKRKENYKSISLVTTLKHDTKSKIFTRKILSLLQYIPSIAITYHLP
jgi:hypothetical protein